MEPVIVNGVDIEILKREITAGYTPSSATIISLIDIVLTAEREKETLIRTMRDALEDAEFQLNMFADCDPEDTDAHNAHAKVQEALASISDQ